MTEISAVIITLDEEENIRKCLKTLEWCDEIIVVDSQSKDKTVEIAKEFTDNILHVSSSGSFDHLREKGIKEASGEWILRVDADEMIPRTLAQKLKSLKDSEYDVIKAPRQNYIFGEWMKGCGWWPDYQTLMFRPEALDVSEQIHEWDSLKEDAKAKKLPEDEELAFKHFTRRGSKDFISHMNRYTSIEAEQASSHSVPGLLVKPAKEFVKRFIVLKGYSEGYRGLTLSLLRTVYVLVAEMKKIEKDLLGNEEEFRERYEETSQKVLDSYVN